MSRKPLEEMKTAGRILRETESLYVIMSDSTRLPFVVCDAETYDDEILVFDNQESAQNTVDTLTGEGYLVRSMMLPVDKRLAFFSSLFSIGVNAVMLDKGMENQCGLELTQFITRPEVPRFSAETARQLKTNKSTGLLVENPEFHLTAVYYIQKVRNRKAERYQKEAGELHEEMMAHYRKGYYLAARLEDGGIPVLKKKEGLGLQPLFTDIQEFSKFQRANAGMKLQNLIVSEKDFLKIMVKEASGIIINPFGISLVLQVKRNPAGRA